MRLLRVAFIPILGIALVLSLRGPFAPLVEGLVGAPMATITNTYVAPTLLWAFGAYLVAKLIDVFILDGSARRALGRPLPKLVRQFVFALICMLAGTFVASNIFGLSVAGVWATSGVFGIALGFGARTLINDLLAGLAIAADQSIRIGDWIEYRDRNLGFTVFGQVIAMNWRSVRVLLRDKRTMVLPNHLLSMTAVLNHTIPTSESRWEFWIPLSLDVPHERALRVLGAAARAAVLRDGMAESPAPKVYVSEVAGDVVRYKVEYFQRVADISPAGGRHVMLETILSHLRLAGLRPARGAEDVVIRRPGDEKPFDSLADRTEMLGQVALLADALSEDELETLAATAKLRIAASGEALVQQGDAGDSMFVVAEGLLEAQLPAKDGEPPAKLGRINPGEFFGEMSLLTGEKRTATVVAITGVRAYEITRENIQTLLETRPEIGEALEFAVLERRYEIFDAMMAVIDTAHEEERKPSGSELLDRMRSFLTGRKQT